MTRFKLRSKADKKINFVIYGEIEEVWPSHGDVEEVEPEDLPQGCTTALAKAGRCNPETGLFFGNKDPTPDEISQMRLDTLLESVTIPTRAVDWAPIPTIDCGPVRNQGYTSTCWAFAFSGLWYAEMKKKDPNTAFPSPLWLVANLNASVCNGGTIPAAFDVANQFGMLPEGAFPGDQPSLNPIVPNSCNAAPRSITTALAKYAAKYASNVNIGKVSVLFGGGCGPKKDIFGEQDDRALNYSRNYGTSCIGGETKAQAIYKMLAQGYPVLVGLYTSKEFERFGTTAPCRTLGGGYGHAVLFVAFQVVGSIPCFLVKNSWFQDSYVNGKLTRRPWGDNGYRWLSTETAASWINAYSYQNVPFVAAPPVFRLTSNPDTLPPATGKATSVPNTPTIIPAPSKPTVVTPAKPTTTTTTSTDACTTCVASCRKQFKSLTDATCKTSRLCSAICLKKKEGPTFRKRVK